jgi:protein involved in polysaccharide export with SLBB domain
VRYSLIRSGQNGDAVRVDVTAGVAGSLTLYRVDAAGNLKRVYPVNDNDAAVQVVPNVAMQIPMDPVKLEPGEKLRLIVVPAPAAAINGAVGGVVGSLAGATPIVIDIPVDAK